VGGESVEEAADVVVDEADDGDTDGWGLGGGVAGGGEQGSEEADGGAKLRQRGEIHLRTFLARTNYRLYKR
jgi:hypothetical protein